VYISQPTNEYAQRKQAEIESTTSRV
jgi:hypothetical protein